jgi:hypothetical protein
MPRQTATGFLGLARSPLRFNRLANNQIDVSVGYRTELLMFARSKRERPIVVFSRPAAFGTEAEGADGQFRSTNAANVSSCVGRHSSSCVANRPLSSSMKNTASRTASSAKSKPSFMTMQSAR